MERETIEQTAERIVKIEVYACMTPIVYTMAKAWGERIQSEDLAELVELAAGIFSPVMDYEDAARAAGWETADLTPGRFINDSDLESETPEIFDATSEDTIHQWAELCDEKRIEPYEREVFEAWAVSEWLADKLESKGEKVERDFAGLNIWSRLTSGQAISLDYCIQQIAQDVRLGR